jgi:ADP-ribosylglycohydrolase
MKPNKEAADPLEAILTGIQEGDDIGGPTEIAKRLSHSLAKMQAFTPRDISDRYLDWWRSGAFDIGPTFSMVFSRASQGMNQERAVRETDKLLDGATAGCNPAHRIAPMAAFSFIETENIPVFARTEARLTHWHEHAGDTASIVALLCRFLVQGNDWPSSKALAEKLDPRGWATVLSGKVSDRGHAPDVVKTAIHFLDLNADLSEIKKFAGPANYSPVIFGVLKRLSTQV